jgi:hypothetical protein
LPRGGKGILSTKALLLDESDLVPGCVVEELRSHSRAPTRPPDRALDTSPMIEIDEDAIDADVRRSLDGIDLKHADAGARIWQGYLDHAGRPLNWSTHFDSDHENDLLYFFGIWGNGELDVTIQRRVGVVSDGDYAGTIQSEVRVTIADVEEVDNVDIEQYGERLNDFRRAVEATGAFTAMTTGRVAKLQALAFYR